MGFNGLGKKGFMGSKGLKEESHKGLRDKEKLDQEEINILRIALPSVVMLVAIFLMLLNYLQTSNEVTQNRIEDKFIKIAENYALSFKNELQAITKAGEPIGILISQYAKEDLDIAVDIASTFCDNSDAFEVVVANTEGEGITKDGTSVNLSLEEYFVDETCTEQQFYYTKNNCIFLNQAIVAVIPIITEDKVSNIMYLYFNPESFKTVINEYELSGKYMYAIVDESDNVIWNSGYNSIFIDNKKCFENFENAKYLRGSYESLIHRISLGGQSSLIAEREDETKYVVITRLGIEKWYLVLGTDYNQVKSMEQKDCRLEKNMFGWIILSITIFFVLIIGMNISHKNHFMEHSKKLESKAETDLLTDLNNKISTEQKIKEYISQNPKSQSMLFILDVDNFKKINDTMGHAFGDEVLRTLGQKLKAEFRISDIVGRTGGDEFIIFLKDVSNDALIEKEATRVQRFFNEFTAGDYIKYSATASIGVAIFPRDAKNFESLYKTADLALYKAKKRGKNQLAFFNEIY